MDFSFLTSNLPDSALGWANLTAIAIAASSGIAAGIAKLTNNKTAGEVSGWLNKLHDLFGFIGFHGQTLQEKKAPRPGGLVHDHRTK